ncbi:hypothetical protein [Bacillus subtilis]|uniref:hypothetical protein n=1 Tax=Bacillus subtilis TaxID=1423 RepID=UPI002776BF99|nr:hypothetical protein [Bacillus subtilis]MDP8527894.1 hypothetical protein [Bacillus subtilis]
MVLLNITWEQVSQFISSIFNSKFVTSGITSWPLAAVIIALSFKKGILDTLKNRKVQVEAGGGNGLKVVVDELIETTKENLKGTAKKLGEGNKTAVKLPKLTMVKSQWILYDVYQASLNNPAKAIKDTWVMFFSDLDKIISYVNENTELSFEGDVLHVMDVLHEHGKISKSTVNAVKGLFDIFQFAEIKSVEKNISESEFAEFANKSKDYYLLCVDALKQLHSELSNSLAEDLQS